MNLIIDDQLKITSFERPDYEVIHFSWIGAQRGRPLRGRNILLSIEAKRGLGGAVECVLVELPEIFL